MSTVGELPQLTTEQLGRLEQMTKGMSAAVEPILKHMILAIVDEESYSEDREVTMDELRRWYTDTDLLRALVLQWSDEERYISSMKKTAIIELRIVLHITWVICADSKGG